ncbi:MAG: DUF2061 domain-containing protein, partial [Nitrososphaerales archaeon]
SRRIRRIFPPTEQLSQGRLVDSRRRSILKTITWRIIATSTTVIGLYAWTGQLFESAGVGIALNGVKSVFYYLHERIWNRAR